MAFVDGTDLRLQAEQRLFAALRGAGARAAEKVQFLRLALQTVEAAGFVENHLLAQLGPPLRMGEIAGAQHVDAFAARPGRQMAGIELLAGGPGETRMDVQVRNKIHV